MFLSQMCKNLEIGKKNVGVGRWVGIAGTVDFWRGVYIYVRPRLVGCDQLAGRFEDNHQKYALNPEQWKGGDHYEPTEKYSEDKNTSVPSPLIQVDVTLCGHSYVFPGFKAWLTLCPLNLSLQPVTNALSRNLLQF